jgi:hypothetical protein
MTDLLAYEELPAPAPLRTGRAPRSRLRVSIASGVAGALGFAGTAMLSDARQDQGEQASALNTAVAEPVLLVSGDGAELARAGSAYGVSVWSSDTRSAVLSAWGALEEGAGPGGAYLEDPRLGDPATPGFTDPCAVRSSAGDGAAGEDGEQGCPEDGRLLPASVLGDRLPPNRASVHAYPSPGLRAAAPCRWEDLGDDQVPVAVVTANPGEVTVTVGDQEATAETSDAERQAWDEWMARPVGVRPPDSFVAHCLAVDRPEGRGPLLVRAVATDDEGHDALAETALTSLVEGLPPLAVTAIDATMVRVDVPLPAGDEPASVLAVPLAQVGGAADCQRVTPEVVAAAGGWRRGASSVTGVGREAGRPWLETAPRLQQVTVALAEGEPNLLCVTYGAASALRRATLLVRPPDARRLTLVVSELQLQGAPPGGTVEVVAAFAELGWAPCRASVPAPGAGITEPGFAGILCLSSGDTGAIAGAGSVVDVSVRAGGTAVHTARVVLSTVPGGPATESYRLPIPRPALEGILCTVGADQPSCRPPDAANTLGSLVLTAHWDEGPIGEPSWQVTAPA